MESFLPDIAGKLFPNFWTWIVQICSTVILFLLFKKYLWKYVLDYFQKRADYIEKNINDSKKMRDDAQKYLEDADQQARASAKEYQSIVAQAKADGEKQRQDIINKANEQARNKLTQADAAIEAEKQKAQTAMKEQIVDVATDVAKKIMNKEMDAQTNDKMVQDFVDEVMR